MLRAYLVAMCLLLPISAATDENAFSASLENPTISSVITEFEKVCFPFIAHETELTAEQDRAVFQSRMVEAGYEFGEEKEWEGLKRLDKFNHAPTNCPEGSLPTAVPPRVEGNYTVFPASGRYRDLAKQKVPNYYNGIEFTHSDGQKNKGKISASTQISIGPNCEVFLRSDETIRKTHYTRRRYEKGIKPKSAYLTWQDVPDFTDQIIKAKRSAFSYNSYPEFKVRTSFPPASSCAIHANDESLTAHIVESSIIAHDSDWKRQDVKVFRTKEIISDAYSWRQCTKQDEENYVYTVSLKDGSFSLSVEAIQDEEFSPSHGCKGTGDG